MTLVIVIPDRGTVSHPLPNDAATVCRIVGRLAPHIHPTATWTVEP